MIGFNRRFDPSFKAVHDAIRQGEIGDLRQVTITSRDPDVPSVAYMKVAGGLLRDMTIHDFDLARYLLGDEPIKVACFAQALIAQEVKDLNDHDTAMIIMETATGRQACITNYRRATYGYDQRIEAVGETGMVKAENRRPHTMERWDAQTTEAKAPVLNFFIERYQEAYNAEIQAFVDAVESERTDAGRLRRWQAGVVAGECGVRVAGDRQGGDGRGLKAREEERAGKGGESWGNDFPRAPSGLPALYRLYGVGAAP